MRTRMTIAGAAMLAAMALAVPTAAQASTGSSLAAASASAYCGQYWGSLPEASDAGLSYGVLTSVRTGRHDCFDRMVIDVDGPVGGYTVQYDPDHRLYSTTGDYPRGGAYLVIYVQNLVVPQPAPSHASTAVGDPDEVADVSSYRTFRQVKELIYGPAGVHGPEGDTFLLGVRAHLPFRVFTLAGPGDGARLVIDVAHRW